MDEITYNITGGRDAGFRGYTYKSNMVAGRWEVNVLTLDGMVLGVINFTVSHDNSVPSRNLVKVVL